ncbi:MAG: hypothetical protein E5V94_02030 [Mesorhizobium sp.]|nr:MAG: hypothetical protein E5V94_02030 [Mesorhizobium sp.]
MRVPEAQTHRQIGFQCGGCRIRPKRGKRKLRFCHLALSQDRAVCPYGDALRRPPSGHVITSGRTVYAERVEEIAIGAVPIESEVRKFQRRNRLDKRNSPSSSFGRVLPSSDSIVAAYDIALVEVGKGLIEFGKRRGKGVEGLTTGIIANTIENEFAPRYEDCAD